MHAADHSPFDTSGIEVGADGIKRYTGLTQNVVTVLQRTAERHGHRTAIVELGGPSITYAELWDRARRVAGGLRNNGVNPGDRVNIPCSLANMGGSIQFAKDYQPIILDSGCAQCQLDISNDGQASLTITRVSQRDQGHWQCWRLDAAGKVKQRVPIIQLLVSNSPELPVLVVNDKELLGGNSSTSRPTASPVSRRWCAGTTPAAGFWSPVISCPPRRARASSGR